MKTCGDGSAINVFKGWEEFIRKKEPKDVTELIRVTHPCSYELLKYFKDMDEYKGTTRSKKYQVMFKFVWTAIASKIIMCEPDCLTVDDEDEIRFIWKLFSNSYQDIFRKQYSKCAGACRVDERNLQVKLKCLRKIANCLYDNPTSRDNISYLYRELITYECDGTKNCGLIDDESKTCNCYITVP